MRSLSLILVVSMAASLLLAACANAATASPSPLPPTPTVPAPTSTPLPPTPTPSAHPTEQATAAPCDPSGSDSCIVDGDFPLQRPIAVPGNNVVDAGYPFGSTAGATREPHHGVEFQNPTGTPVLAAAQGIVFYAGDDSTTLFSPWPNMYGNLVVLQHTFHGRTIFTLYAHLSIINVISGQSIEAGDKLGEVGMSGTAIGSHLHFEVRLDAQDYYSTLNPQLWFQPLPGEGILSIRLVDAAGNFLNAPISVQHFPDPGKSFTRAWQLEAYPGELLRGNNWENALLGDLVPGRYRITFLWEGVWQERWVDLQAGRLTLVEFRMK
jgi:murein DD-endopeptidase MepM/ murein hydrolase activator NlpD